MLVAIELPVYYFTLASSKFKRSQVPQPLVNGTTVLAFNGEVYNYRDLNSAARSDAEVKNITPAALVSSLDTSTLRKIDRAQDRNDTPT